MKNDLLKWENLCPQTFKAKANTYNITDSQRKKKNIYIYIEKNNKNAKGSYL